MDDLARIADRRWPSRWSLHVERPAGGHDRWRAQLRTTVGHVMLEAVEPTAQAALEAIAAGLRRLDAGRPVRVQALRLSSAAA